MSALEWTRKSDFELHPAGEWRAAFVEWAEDKHDKYGIQVKLSFDTEVLMEDNRPYRISVWTKPSLHAKGRVHKLLTALGFDPDSLTDEDLKTFTLDRFLGQKLRLTIAHEEKKDANGRGTGEMTHKITGFLNFKKAPVRTAANFGGEEGSAEAGNDQAAAPPATVPAGVGGKAAAPNWNDED